ncbi:hypothetical protein NESM_000112200 [Novymonas esmeraldas]|uniref:Uncharacterized protein n=1 Tax=Novymonas esmeraldas TaxID=1808958 RepID=A0AAW0F2X6_9TRYP
MPPQAQRRKRSTSELKFQQSKRRRVSESLVERGIGKEVDRTLPFWRCYVDLRMETGRLPEVTARETKLLCRRPCKVFKRVDVVWARTTVSLQPVHVQTWEERKQCLRLRQGGGAGTAPPPTRRATATTQRVHTIDTVHFVHEDAYKKGVGSDCSFHVQSVVFRDAPHLLQCVGGSMVSFSFIVYTALRLAHACRARRCTAPQLGRELETLMEVYRTGEGAVAATKAPDRRRARRGASTAASAHDSTSSSSATQPPDALLGRGGQRTPSAAAASALLRAWCPSAAARVLVLGMGGNSMALALRLVLGSEAVIEVVEVEPAVVDSCVEMGTLHEDDAAMRVHLQDADETLARMPHGVFDVVYMDIFEPMQATMRNLHPWVLAARRLLKSGGLLVMNEHQLPSAAAVAPYATVFGEGNVQAVNLRGWSESIVVCVAPGDATTDGYSLEVTKTHANVAFNIYETLLPGWLPHYSWLVKATTYRHDGISCRLWTS